VLVVGEGRPSYWFQVTGFRELGDMLRCEIEAARRDQGGLRSGVAIAESATTGVSLSKAVVSRSWTQKTWPGEGKILETDKVFGCVMVKQERRNTGEAGMTAEDEVKVQLT
jgi:hypothetical protein